MLFQAKFRTLKDKKLPQMKGSIKFDHPDYSNVGSVAKALVCKNMLPEYPVELVEITLIKQVSK